VYGGLISLKYLTAILERMANVLQMEEYEQKLSVVENKESIDKRKSFISIQNGKYSWDFRR
jgi:hypothetical protein